MGDRAAARRESATPGASGRSTGSPTTRRRWRARAASGARRRGAPRARAARWRRWSSGSTTTSSSVVEGEPDAPARAARPRRRAGRRPLAAHGRRAPCSRAGDDARRAARARGRRVARAHRRRARRPGRRRARARRRVRQAAPAVRRAHRLVPGARAPARRRRHRGRRRAAARPRSGVGGRRGRGRRGRARRGWRSCSRHATAQDTTAAALHVHGGYGFTLEYDIQLYLPPGQGVAAARSATRGAARCTSPTRCSADGLGGGGRPDGLPSRRAQRRVPRRGARVPAASTSAPTMVERAHDTGTSHDWEFHRALGAQGWIAASWPEEYGGQGRDPMEMTAMRDELRLAGRPDRRSRSDDHDRPHHPRRRHRRAEAAVHPSRAGGRDHLRPRVHRTRLRLRRRRGEDRARCATATSGSSTARRCSRRWPTRPPTCSCSPAPIPTSPSTRASPCSWCRSTRRAWRSTRCTRWAASAPTPPSTPACACPTRCASARSTAAGTS